MIRLRSSLPEIRLPVKNIETNGLFVERHYGGMEGQKWMPDLDIDGIADVETLDTLFKRAQLALEHIESLPNSVILVVSHGAFCWALRHVISPAIPFNGPLNHFNNAEIVRLI